MNMLKESKLTKKKRTVKNLSSSVNDIFRIMDLLQKLHNVGIIGISSLIKEYWLLKIGKGVFSKEQGSN